MNNNILSYPEAGQGNRLMLSLSTTFPAFSCDLDEII